jgi:O-antigen ligase
MAGTSHGAGSGLVLGTFARVWESRSGGLLVGGVVSGVFGALVSRGRGPDLLLLSGVVMVMLVGLFGRRSLLVLLVATAVLQIPLGALAGFPSLRLTEIVVPLLLVATAIRSLQRDDAGHISRGMAWTRGGARAIHAALLVFAAVVLFGVLRARYDAPASGGVTRAFYAYFIALGLYLLTYSFLVSRRVTVDALCRCVLLLSSVISILGIVAVILHFPLNLGNLTYSVYELQSGAVRVGFLQVFGAIGLSMVVAGAVTRLRIPLAFLFAAALILSGGRTTTAGMLLAIAVYLVVTGRFLRLVLAITLALTVFLTFPGLSSTPQAQRLMNINAKAFDKDGRTQIYAASIKAWEKHPLFGAGVGVPIPVYGRTQELTTFYQAQLTAGGHGTYPALLKNFGLAGFLPFVLAWLLAVAGLMKFVRRSAAAAFLFIYLLSQAVSLAAGGNGSSPGYFFAMAFAAAIIQLGGRLDRTVDVPGAVTSPEGPN